MLENNVNVIEEVNDVVEVAEEVIESTEPSKLITYAKGAGVVIVVAGAAYLGYKGCKALTNKVIKPAIAKAKAKKEEVEVVTAEEVTENEVPTEA